MRAVLIDGGGAVVDTWVHTVYVCLVGLPLLRQILFRIHTFITLYKDSLKFRAVSDSD
jgi:hypothetical protein